MVERNLNFELALSDLKLSFTVAGQTFRCLPECPPLAWARIATAQGNDYLPAALFFIEAVLVEEDVPRWRELLASRQIVIPVDTVMTIAADLLREYAGRPTNGSAGS
ncbi:MAG: hypothetical protein KatS3mg014_2546 [Actinomycetota bacterium]|nr:MAG: hypothetical protein KatS3mg014_2459 [Actinomycetota bacterium]GIV00931.1 MAG: hypothetical protein KatS3mg014_2546 [Actinomycetota bacterium]